MSDDFEKNYRSWHGYWSYVKSLLRIVGCASVIWFGHDIIYLAAWFLAAEIVGIVEEWV